MNVKKLRGSLFLLFASIIWGAAFVAQDEGMKYVGAFTFNGIRMLIGAVVLVPVILIFCKKTSPDGKLMPDIIPTKTEWLAGVLCGVVLFISSSLQQIGISLYTDSQAAAGKAGFITALYIVIVPVLGLFARKKVSSSVWVGITLATVGMYMLCMTTGLSLSMPDIFVLLCAIAFSFHILTVDKFAPLVNGIKLSAIQFAVCGLLSSVCMFIFEEPSFRGILEAAVPILYAGVLSSGVAYTFQILGQKDTEPTVASILMSLESVFAAITGAMFGERLSTRELIGCLLVFLAVIISQLDFGAIFKRKAD